MHVHPAIAALRSDPATQRRAQAAMEAALSVWSDQDSVASIRRELDLFASGSDLARLPMLGSLLTDHARARAFVDQLFGEFLCALRKAPLGEVPMRHGSSDGFARLQIMHALDDPSFSAALSLCVYEPLAAKPDATAIMFSDCESYEIVVAGDASGHSFMLESASDGAHTLSQGDSRWTCGDTIALRARRDARQVRSVKRSLVVLQLSRTPTRAQPSQEYRISDGAPLRQSSGDKRASQHVLALAVLGAMKHRDAIGPMQDYAANTAHDPDARWEAVRQLLALDTARGFALLNDLSSRTDDPLALPSRDLRQNLLAAYPALRIHMMETT